LLFDMAIRGVHLGVRDVIPLLLLAAALRLLLAVLGRGGRLNQSGDVWKMNPFYHISLIGMPASKL